jgi:hypothetical protein
MAAKITPKNEPIKKPAAKPAAEKPVRKVRESKKPEAKGRLSKGRPDLSATPTKTKVAKPKALRFRDLWKENVSDIKTFVNRVFHDDNDARTYIDYAEGYAPDGIRNISSEILRNMHDDSKQDVDRAYRRALISFNLGQLPPDQVALVHRLYSAQSIANWHREISHPSEETLEELEGHGIYLCAGSVLMMDEFQQPPKGALAPAPKYNEGDDIFEIFTKRDLERAPYLAQDYEHNLNNLDFSDYEALGKISAFRAMIELWPKSFRHYANAHTDVRNLTWTFITDAFTAVVSSSRVEVTVGTEEAGYSLYARVGGLQEAVERVFWYFNTLSTDQLAGLLKTVGFDTNHVAGMKFDLMAGRDFNPTAFMRPSSELAVEIYHNSSRMSAGDFLLTAAQTTRGVYFEREDTLGSFDVYDMYVGGLKFRVLYLDNEVYKNGDHRGVASMREHQNNLSALKSSMVTHGVYLDDKAVMHLPLSADAESNFHPETEIGVNDTEFYMHSVTFV